MSSCQLFAPLHLPLYAVAHENGRRVSAPEVFLQPAFHQVIVTNPTNPSIRETRWAAHLEDSSEPKTSLPASMYFSISSAIVLLVSAQAVLASPTLLTQRSISTCQYHVHTILRLFPENIYAAVYNDLVFYFKYASSSYGYFSCPKPNGNTLVTNVRTHYTKYF